MSKKAKLGVFGRPVAHSRSPEIHKLFAIQTDIPLSYEKVLVPEGKFNSMAAEFLQTGTGFNITTPYKHEAFQFVTEHSPAALSAGAVNTISINAAGVIRGDNTDGPGLVQDMTRNLGWQIGGKKLLVLGAGGAVSGVLADLLGETPEAIHLHNRTHEKATALAQRFGDARLTAWQAEALDTAYDIVINGTSGGMSGEIFNLPNDSLLNDSSPNNDLPNNSLPNRIVHKGSCCYDMVYGTATTPFNRWCLSQADCIVADGLGMLVEQAALAFHIWFNQAIKTPLNTGAVINSLRQTMATL